MNKELEAKIEEEAKAFVKANVIYADKEGRFERHLQYQDLYPTPKTCDGCEEDSLAVYQTYKLAIKSKALIEFLVPYVVGLARQDDETGLTINDIYRYSPEEILAKVWEEIGNES